MIKWKTDPLPWSLLWTIWSGVALSLFVVYALSSDSLTLSSGGGIIAYNNLPWYHAQVILGTVIIGLNGLPIILAVLLGSTWVAVVIELLQWSLIRQRLQVWLLKWQNTNLYGKISFPTGLVIYFLVTGCIPAFLFFCVSYAEILTPDVIAPYIDYIIENENPPNQLVSGGIYFPFQKGLDLGMDIWVRYKQKVSNPVLGCDPQQKNLITNWFLQYGLAASIYPVEDLKYDRAILQEGNLLCLSSYGFDDKGRPEPGCSSSWHLYHKPTELNYERYYCAFL